jgi:hypothetical protein
MDFIFRIKGMTLLRELNEEFVSGIERD